MSDAWPPRLIEIEPDPIPGTHLYRRRQGEREIQPEYLGPAQNELAAIAEASEHGFKAVMCAGSSYVRLGGTWYRLNRSVHYGAPPRRV